MELCYPASVRLLVFAWCILAASAAPADPWLRVRSANFELFTTAGEKNGRDLVRHFEQVRSFFLQAFQLDGVRREPVRIISFRSDKEYQPYRPSEVAEAFFQPGIDHDYIVMKNSSRELYAAATHEYTHLLLRQTRIEIPLWLNEGLAELYSSLEPSGDKIVVGVLIGGRLQTLTRETWIPLPTLLSVTTASPLYNEKSHAGVFYAESWALVHMLSLDDWYQPRLNALLEALKTNDSATAFQKAYGKTLEQVQADLRAYFDGHPLYGAVFDVQLRKSVDAPEIQTNAALPARLALAELLSNDTASLTRAQAAFKQLAHDYPDRWQVEEGWADFFARERRNTDALQHFARAAALGSTDARMYIAYGRLLNAANRSPDAVASFRQAIRLDPSLDDAHFELAISLVRAGTWREAVSEFHLIKHLDSQAGYRYFYYLAYAHARLGDTEQARALLGKARSYTHNPEQLSALDQLQNSLEH